MWLEHKEAKTETKTIVVQPEKFIIELDREEAEMLSAVLGRFTAREYTYNNDDHAKFMRLWNLLRDAGVVGHDNWMVLEHQVVRRKVPMRG